MLTHQLLHESQRKHGSETSILAGLFSCIHSLYLSSAYMMPLWKHAFVKCIKACAASYRTMQQKCPRWVTKALKSNDAALRAYLLSCFLLTQLLLSLCFPFSVHPLTLSVSSDFLVVVWPCRVIFILDVKGEEALLSACT